MAEERPLEEDDDEARAEAFLRELAEAASAGGAGGPSSHLEESPRPAQDESLRDIVLDFVLESREGLDRVEGELMALEQEPASRERIGAVFAAVHTLKGTAGFLGFGQLESLAHAGEDLLCDLREGTLAFDAGIADALLAMADAARQLLDRIERGEEEGDVDLAPVLAALLERGAGAPAADPSAAPAGLPLDEAVPQGGGASDGTIRIPVELLDRLMNPVGELVLARNRMLQHAATSQDRTLLATAQRLDLVTNELQEGVMKTRMQPIGAAWARLPRLVRDLGRQLGKQVRVVLEGQETELDKSLIEAIRDPLTHAVRNAVGHGLEAPAERRSAGKPGEGTLTLRASHESGHVLVEVEDDGRGVDLARVRRRAMELGVPGAADDRLGERELLQLLFTPGFSTADSVSNLSGRGVGMDVVKSRIEASGGTVELSSAPGVGATLRLKIPLTLAIVPALLILAGEQRFAIPQVSLLELVRLEGEQRRAIERVHGSPVYRLREHLLPLVDLAGLLRLELATADDEAVNIVVLQAGERTFGLIVSEILDTEEIVVKPLSRQLKGLGVFAGATILGDGRVALILDVPGLAPQARVAGDREERRRQTAVAEERPEETERRERLLLVGVGTHGRAGLPLSAVARLEEVDHEAIERSGRREVVQYRGQIMPLVRLTDALGLPRSELPEGGRLAVVVFRHESRLIGLAVDQILDVVEERVEVAADLGADGLLGSAVVQRRVTDLLDLPRIAASAGLTGSAS